MKTRRLASALALATAVVLGASGCGFAVNQATTHSYAPSDGIDVSLDGLDVRNLMLVADSSGENFNVVFSGVNNSDSSQAVKFTFEGESGQASAGFNVQPGRTLFGDPNGDVEPTLVSLRGVNAGDTVNTFIEVAGGEKVERAVPVLDGTLEEYKDFVL